MENLIGKTIRIIALDVPYGWKYYNVKGIVEEQGEDFEHEVFLRGTWGGVAVYPAHDYFEVVNQKGE